MKPYRAVSIVLLIAFLINVTAPISSVKAQSPSLFDGTIAYIGVDGNVYILQKNGATVQLTNDAHFPNDPNEYEGSTYYDCLNFREDGKYLAFNNFRLDNIDYTKLYLYDLEQGKLVGEFNDVYCMNTVFGRSELVIGMGWLEGQDPFYVSETEYLTEDYSEQRVKAYAYKLSGEKYLIFDIKAYGWISLERDGINTVSYYETADEQKIAILNWVTNEKTYKDSPSSTGASLFDCVAKISETECLSLNENDEGFYSLYLIDQSTSESKLIYSPDEEKTIYYTEQVGENLIFQETEQINDLANSFYMLDLHILHAPEIIDNNVAYPWWSSRDNAALYYVRLVDTEGDQLLSLRVLQRELNYFNLGTREKQKMLNLVPDLGHADSLDAYRFIMRDPIDFYYGEMVPGTVPLVTTTPSTTTTLTAISDLRVTLNSPMPVIGGTLNSDNVKLTWSFPTINDNNIHYDLRYSESPLNESNWDSATRIENVPAPMKFGQTQEAYAQVPDNKRIYFGIKIVDQDGNSSPISNVPSFFDTSFRPIEDGYRYCNKGKVKSEQDIKDCNREWLKYPAELTSDILIQLFGDEACSYKIDGMCKPAPLVNVWALAHLNFSKGLCYGMSTSSIVLTTEIGQNNWNDPGDFQPQARYVSEISEPNGNAPAVFYQVTQSLYPIRDALSKDEPSANEFINRLYGLVAQKDYPVLIMAEASTGHALFPFAIEEHSDGTYFIWVYDPNYPSVFDVHPEKRFLLIDVRNNTWQYEFQEGDIWSNANYTLRLLPSSLYEDQPYSVEDIFKGIDLFPLFHANVVATNSTGQTIGYINGELVNQIPNAQAIPYLDDASVNHAPSYALPPDTYAASLDGEQGQIGGIAQFGKDYAIMFDNLALSPQLRDQVTISPDGRQISFNAASPQNFNWSTAFRESQQTLGVYFSDFSVNANQPLSVKIDSNTHSIVLGNISSTGVCSFTIERFTSTTYNKFTDTALPLTPNDTQIIEYGTEGDIKILIDHQSDGSIDETRVMQKIESQTKSFLSVIFDSPYFIAGGLGLLCLTVLAIGGVFVYTRTRKPKRAPAKSVVRPQPSKPVSGSAEQVKRAIELSKAKRHQEAFEILRGIVQAEPNNMSAWFNLGGVLASMGNFKDAERCYSRAKQLGHPKGEDALNWLRQHRK